MGEASDHEVSIPSEDHLRALGDMLQVVLDKDVYNIAADNQNRGVQLGWFQRLLDCLVKQQGLYARYSNLIIW